MRSRLILATVLLWLIAIPLLKGASPILSWVMDMYDQPSVGSFEEGGVIEFPVGSVTTEGQMISSDGYENKTSLSLPWADFSPDGFRYNPALTPANPVVDDRRSLENGEYMYAVNCAACHGADGRANNNLSRLRSVPSIAELIPELSEGYLYLRITYGGPIITSMPPLGYSMSEQERWDVVNYMKQEFKQ